MRSLKTCKRWLTAGLVLPLLGTFEAQAAPVETGPPNAENQSPAFPGQTRAPALPATEGLEYTAVTDSLEHPWGLQFLPNGRLLITERPGTLRVVTQQGKISDPVAGVPEVVARGQGGLLDVTLSPSFNKDRLVYLSYSEPRKDGKNGTAVARGKLSADERRLTNVEVIFRQMPAWDSNLHFGSRLVWADDGHLFVTLGERSYPEPRQLAQDISTHLGKVVRIAADGSVPADNPFVNKEGADEVWSYGHRNPQGAAIHPGTGRLWTIEHGPRGGDEINRPEPGKNYGWPVITYGIDYSGKPIGKGITQKPGMEQPLYYWDPVIAPGGMLFYSGKVFKDWENNLIISSLNPGGIVRLTLDGTKVTGEERLLGKLGRVRDITEDAHGYLWLITDDPQGKLIRLEKAEENSQ